MYLQNQILYKQVLWETIILNIKRDCGNLKHILVDSHECALGSVQRKILNSKYNTYSGDNVSVIIKYFQTIPIFTYNKLLHNELLVPW